MRTQFEWLMTLPQDISFQAIQNAKAHTTRMYASSLKEAMEGAFKWSTSPQGQDYWNEVANGRF